LHRLPNSLRGYAAPWMFNVTDLKFARNDSSRAAAHKMGFASGGKVRGKANLSACVLSSAHTGDKNRRVDQIRLFMKILCTLNCDAAMGCCAACNFDGHMPLPRKQWILNTCKPQQYQYLQGYTPGHSFCRIQPAKPLPRPVPPAPRWTLRPPFELIFQCSVFARIVLP